MPFIIGNTYVSSYSLELAIFFIVSSFISVLILLKLRGRFSNFSAFFASKPLPFMKTNSKLLLMTRVFSLILIIFLISPIASLFLWGAVVIKLEEDYPTGYLSVNYVNQTLDFTLETTSYSDSHLGGKSIFLVGFACLCLAFASIQLKLSNFQIKFFGILCFFLGFGVFFAWKIIVLMDDTPVSFFGMTAIFFGLNAMVMIPLIFLFFSEKSGSIAEIVKGLEFGSISNTKNFDTIEDLINEQLGDPSYTVTQLEVFRMINSFKNAEDLGNSALGGGFLVFFKKISKIKKQIILFVLYLCAIGVLVAYSLVIYYYGEDSRKDLGFLNLVMVSSTDLMLFFFQRVKIKVNPLEVSLLMISNRVFLYAFGGDMWFIGYCCLYILLNIPMCHYIVDNNWPLSDYALMKGKQVLDISRTPEFVTLISTAIFLILIVVLALADISGVPTQGFSMDNGKDYPFWAFGLASIFFVVIFLLFWISVRIYRRYTLKIKDLVFYYLFSVSFDMYYLSLSCTYLCIILLGGLCYASTDESFPLIFCCFIPVMYELLMIIKFNWNLNDYRFPADTQMINNKMKKCREKIEAQTKKTKTFKTIKTEMVQEKNSVEVEKKNVEIEKNLDDYENLLNIETANNKKPEANNLENEVEPEEAGPMDPEIWAKNGITQFSDWRAMGIPFWKAFLTNYLIPTDYKIIYGGLFFFIVDAGYCLACAFGSKDYKLIGPSIGVAIFTAVCFALPIISYKKTLNRINLEDTILILMGAGANYGYGFFYFFDQINNIETDSSTYYLLFFVFVLPGAFFLLAGYQLWEECRFKLNSNYIFIYFIAGFIHFFALGVFLCIVISYISGGVVIATTAFVILVLFLFFKFKSNNNSVPRLWLIISISLLFLICFTALIVALILSELNDFVGYSIFIISFTSILFVLNLFIIYNDLSIANKQPIFFSPWIFPVYIYDTKLNSIKQHNFPYLIFFACLLTWFIWSITTCIWVKPAMIGISIATLLEVILLLFVTYFSCFSSLKIGNFTQSELFIPKALKKSWLIAKKDFMLRKGVTDPDDILSYKFHVEQLEKAKAKLNDDLREFILNKNDEVNLRARYKNIYNGSNICQVEYISEVRLLIHFLLELIVISYNLVNEEKMRMINFVQNDRSNLFNYKIFIILETEKTIDDKYIKIKRQYNNLDNEKRHIFDVLKKKFDDKKRKEKIEIEKKHKAEEAAKKERMEALNHLNRPDKIDWSKPLNEIPDCLEKYQKIVENYKKNGTKYEDTAFPANEKVLGDKLKNLVANWQRPSPDAKVFKQGYNPLDIQQGAIGDCYFMSAISVLGEKYIKNCFYLEKLENQDDGCGAYIVKFSVGEQIVDIIIDDYFPVDVNNKWVFGHSVDPAELWPLILEKAYAKLYTGYFAIIGGKVSYALSELSGGVADEINLTTFQSKPDSFWRSLQSFYSQGYLLGAGSPENPQGDAAFSEEGIVQGHAYAVLSVRDLDEVKLIKLRNPHGNHGREWTGDWSDNSYKWTTKLKAKINDEFAEDGAFWMCIEDFLYEFKYLYVCRIFEEKLWRNLESIHGEWNGVTAAGLPTKDNPKAKLQNNPQYLITVKKKATAFITLIQKEAVDTFKGKLPIFFMIQKEGGKKITAKIDEKLVGSSGAPTNLKSIGKEIDLLATSYPSSFTLMVASAFAGDRGKGSFYIRISCTDQNVKVQELK